MRDYKKKVINGNTLRDYKAMLIALLGHYDAWVFSVFLPRWNIMLFHFVESLLAGMINQNPDISRKIKPNDLYSS